MGNRTVDEIIAHLRCCGEKKLLLNLTESEIKYLCAESIKVFMSQPMLLEVDPPIVICGDIHGYYYKLMNLFGMGGFPPDSDYLFLGDYVDRGKNCVETICLLLAYKVKYPYKFHLLRGNHECGKINFEYGFYDECVKRYNADIWKKFVCTFNCMPAAAIVAGKVFCCHGGLSPSLNSMDQIRDIGRPTVVPRKGLLCDLLWSDPKENIKGYAKSTRGLGYLFGSDVVKGFLEKHDLNLLCRAHELVPKGYRFFANKGLVTIFSIPGYCEATNDGAFMTMNKRLKCSFKILKYCPCESRY